MLEIKPVAPAFQPRGSFIYLSSIPAFQHLELFTLHIMPQAIGLATVLLPGKFPLTLASLPLKFGSQFTPDFSIEKSAPSDNEGQRDQTR